MTMITLRALKFVAILLVGLLLAGPNVALAQNGNIWDAVDVNALTQQIAQLYLQGRYSDAIPLAKRVLALRESSLGPEHGDVARSLFY